MLTISNAKIIHLGYQITIMTDRLYGRGCLYYMKSKTACEAVSQMSAEDLKCHEVATWSTRVDDPLVSVVEIHVEGGGFLVASEMEPGPDTQWSEPYPVRKVTL
jgi:hypothetical protein